MIVRQRHQPVFAFLAAQLELGASLRQALQATGEVCRGANEREFWSLVCLDIASGHTLSDALDRMGMASGVVSLLRAGERNGTVPRALQLIGESRHLRPSMLRRPAQPIAEEEPEPMTRVIMLSNALMVEAISRGASGLALHPGWPWREDLWPPAGRVLPPRPIDEAVPAAPAALADEVSPSGCLPALLRRKGAARKQDVMSDAGGSAPECFFRPYFRLDGLWQPGALIRQRIAGSLTRRFLYLAEMPYWEGKRQEGGIGIQLRERHYDLRFVHDPNSSPVLVIEIDRSAMVRE